MSSFDLDAELAAFAEVEQLAEQTQVQEQTSTNNATNEAVTAAAATVAASAAAASSAAASAVGAAATPQAVGQKRKAATGAESAPNKRPSAFIVAAEATSAEPEQVQTQAQGVFSDVVSADLAAMQHRQAAAAQAANPSFAAAASESAAAAAASSTAAAASSGGYITGRVYNGWLATLHPVTGAPMWVEATSEQIEAAAANDLIEAQAAADAAATAAAEAKRVAKKERKAAAKIGGVPLASGGIASGVDAATAATQEKHHLRSAAGKVWDDPTLQDWPESQFTWGQQCPQTHFRLQNWNNFKQQELVLIV